MARRPQFDRRTVLTQAMRLFWERGYHAVSVSDLVKTTGLLPGSLYASFGNKEGIYIAALQHYSEATHGKWESHPLPGSPLEAVHLFYRDAIENAAAAKGQPGCFLVNASLECDTTAEAIQACVRKCLDRGDTWLTALLARAVEAGELRPETDPQQLASCLMSTIFGLQVMSRAKESAQKIRGVGEAHLDCLLSPWQSLPA